MPESGGIAPHPAFAHLQPQFPTALTVDSRGGLIICGMNYGDGGGGPGMANPHLAPPGTFCGKANSYPYQRTFIKWLGLWGHSCNEGGMLDRLISQTNFFLDSSRTFTQRGAEEWQQALRRLCAAFEALQPSGLLICSIGTMRKAYAVAQTDPALPWHGWAGRGDTGESHRFENRFFVDIVRDAGARMPVAAIKHPAGRGTTDQSVHLARPVMQPWLDTVLENYRKRKN